MFANKKNYLSRIDGQDQVIVGVTYKSIRDRSAAWKNYPMAANIGDKYIYTAPDGPVSILIYLMWYK